MTNLNFSEILTPQTNPLCQYLEQISPDLDAQKYPLLHYIQGMFKSSSKEFHDFMQSAILEYPNKTKMAQNIAALGNKTILSFLENYINLKKEETIGNYQQLINGYWILIVALMSTLIIFNANSLVALTLMVSFSLYLFWKTNDTIRQINFYLNCSSLLSLARSL